MTAWTETELPRIKMRRNPAGGYVATLSRRIGYATLKEWQDAINAKAEDHWSGESGMDTASPFRQARLKSLRARRYNRWLREMLDQIMEVDVKADGLATYEVAAFLDRSLRTAQRFIKRVRARRVYRGHWRNRRWTGRYDFWASVA